MDAINQYRTNWIPDALISNKSFKGKQLEYIKKYGYQFAYEFYSPHSTLAGPDIEDSKFEELKAELDNKQEAIHCIVENLCLIDRDDNNKLIAQIRIGK
jgi:hypothetical protein